MIKDSRARILVAAPHTSYLDTLLVGRTGATAVVAAEFSVSCLGVVGNFIRTIWVNRETIESRRYSLDSIISRAQV